MNYRHGGLQTPPLTKIHKILIGLLVAGFLGNAISSKFIGVSLLPIFGLTLSGISSGMIWQPFTYTFLNTGLFSLLFDCLILWFLGYELERLWGERFYLKYLAFGVVTGAIVYLILGFAFFSQNYGGVPLFGATGLGLLLLLAYGLLYPEREFLFMFVFPIKAKYFCLILGGIQLYSAVFSANGQAAWAHLASMGGGFAYLRGLSWLAKHQRESGVKKKDAAKRKFRVIQGDREEKATPKDPKYWQ